MIRASHPTRLILVRHVETTKNTQGRHGGGDQAITARGLRQAEQLSSFLRQLHDESSIIYCQPETRSHQTAQLVSGAADTAPQSIELLRGIDMGAVSGLSDKELVIKYPLVALSYLLWRSGFSLRRPKIAGAESIADFAQRSRQALERLATGPHRTVVFVGTTSTILMLNHLLQNDGKLVRKSYHFYELKLGHAAQWSISPDSPPRQITYTKGNDKETKIKD